jgi:hypothetical protein
MRAAALGMLVLMLARIDAIGQTCQRTLTVNIFSSGAEPEVADFEATVGRQTLTVTKVEPVRSSRLLLLMDASHYDIRRDRDLKRLVRRLEAIDSIPQNVALAYGIVYADRAVFSDGFTSDPQEVRKSLDTLIAQAGGSAPRKMGDAYKTANDVVDLFTPPRPGDAVVWIAGDPWLAGFLLKSSPVQTSDPLVERYLERGLRFFVMGGPWHPSPSTGTDWADKNVMQFAEATGGFWSQVQSTDGYWRTVTETAYQVTVSIPPGIQKRQWSWKLRLRGSPKKFGLLSYPDLLLCDSGHDGRSASAVRPRFGP